MCVRHLVICIMLVIFVAAPWSFALAGTSLGEAQGGSASDPEAAWVLPRGTAGVRPPSIVLPAFRDEGEQGVPALLSALRWRSWGGDLAEALGELRRGNSSQPVAVTLGERQNCFGRRLYTTLSTQPSLGPQIDGRLGCFVTRGCRPRRARCSFSQYGPAIPITRGRYVKITRKPFDGATALVKVQDWGKTYSTAVGILYRPRLDCDMAKERCPLWAYPVRFRYDHPSTCVGGMRYTRMKTELFGRGLRLPGNKLSSVGALRKLRARLVPDIDREGVAKRRNVASLFDAIPRARSAKCDVPKR